MYVHGMNEQAGRVGLGVLRDRSVMEQAEINCQLWSGALQWEHWVKFDEGEQAYRLFLVMSTTYPANPHATVSSFVLCETEAEVLPALTAWQEMAAAAQVKL